MKMGVCAIPLTCSSVAEFMRTDTVRSDSARSCDRILHVHAPSQERQPLAVVLAQPENSSYSREEGGMLGKAADPLARRG